MIPFQFLYCRCYFCGARFYWFYVCQVCGCHHATLSFLFWSHQFPWGKLLPMVFFPCQLETKTGCPCELHENSSKTFIWFNNMANFPHAPLTLSYSNHLLNLWQCPFQLNGICHWRAGFAHNSPLPYNWNKCLELIGMGLQNAPFHSITWPKGLFMGPTSTAQMDVSF